LKRRWTRQEAAMDLSCRVARLCCQESD